MFANRMTELEQPVLALLMGNVSRHRMRSLRQLLIGGQVVAQGIQDLQSAQPDGPVHTRILSILNVSALAPERDGN
jgi:hypothetical protein